jgi:hypothetical protein
MGPSPLSFGFHPYGFTLHTRADIVLGLEQRITVSVHSLEGLSLGPGLCAQ